MPIMQKLTLNNLVCLCKSCNSAALVGRAASPSMQSSHWKAVDITSPNFLWPDWYSSNPALPSRGIFSQYFRRSATFFWTAASKTLEDPGSLVTTANGRGVYQVDVSGWKEIVNKRSFYIHQQNSKWLIIKNIQKISPRNSAKRNKNIKGATLCTLIVACSSKRAWNALSRINTINPVN